MQKHAFTLAEVLITLTTIGIITAVIIPVAVQSKPDKNVMKFKKANATLYQAISILVNSDKYFLNGDMKYKFDGTMLLGTNIEHTKYFCKSFSDVISTKHVNCYGISQGGMQHNNGTLAKFMYDENCKPLIDYSSSASTSCKANAINSKEKDNLIVTTDGVTFYDMDPALTFNNLEGWYLTGCNNQDGSVSSGCMADSLKCYGTTRIGKIFCMDIDGIPDGGSKNCDDIKDICPFAYVIRHDGRILPDYRTQQWIDKSI